MDRKIIDRVKRLKQRTTEYSFNHVGDMRADTIWLECCSDIVEERPIEINNYEHRMESLEFGSDVYP